MLRDFFIMCCAIIIIIIGLALFAGCSTSSSQTPVPPVKLFNYDTGNIYVPDPTQ